MKKTINGVVVVEGKTDTAKLKSLFDVQTIQTNGSAIDLKTINLLKQIGLNNKIYLFLDPDGPGEKIRKTLNAELDNTINVFITKKDIAKSSKKFGVAEASSESIYQAFENAVEFKKQQSSISWEQYLDLECNSKHKREIICNLLKISLCNHKQLYKRLNMIGLSYKQIKELIHE